METCDRSVVFDICSVSLLEVATLDKHS